MEKLLHEILDFDQELGVRFRNVNYNGRICPKHWHKSFECLLVTEGSLEFYLNGTLHLLNVGDMVMTNPCDVHGSRCIVPGTKAYLLQFPEELFGREGKNTAINVNQSVFRKDCLADSHFLHKASTLLQQIDEINKKNNLGCELEIKSRIYDFLFTVVSNNICSWVKFDHAKSEKYLIRLNKVIDFIEDNYHLKITLVDCSRQIHVDATYFSRFFKKYMGENFSRYLSLYRMNRAYHDLISTDLKITSVAERNGFSNYKYFLSLFKEIYDSTPMEVRQKLIRHEGFEPGTPKQVNGSFQQMYCH